jgi:hypothetical protein
VNARALLREVFLEALIALQAFRSLKLTSEEWELEVSSADEVAAGEDASVLPFGARCWSSNKAATAIGALPLVICDELDAAEEMDSLVLLLPQKEDLLAPFVTDCANEGTPLGEIKDLPVLETPKFMMLEHAVPNNVVILERCQIKQYVLARCASSGSSREF